MTTRVQSMDRLSNILKRFNDNFGTLFTDPDRVAARIRDDIAPQVAADKTYRNAKENTPHTARMAHDQALSKVMQHLLKDDTQVYSSSSRTIHSDDLSVTWYTTSLAYQDEISGSALHQREPPNSIRGNG